MQRPAKSDRFLILSLAALPLLFVLHSWAQAQGFNGRGFPPSNGGGGGSGGGGSDPAIGGPITGGTQYSVLFVDPAATIAQDNTGLNFNPSTDVLTVGGSGTLAVVNATSSAATDVVLQANNTNNASATANAYLVANTVVGGGDPFFYMAANGVINWGIGVDRSEGLTGILKFDSAVTQPVPGTNTAMQLAHSGAEVLRVSRNTNADNHVLVRNTDSGTGASTGYRLSNGTNSANFALYGTGVPDSAYSGAGDAIISAGSGRLSLVTVGNFPVETWVNNTTQASEVSSTEFVINQPGANYDFRVEGDTDANLLFVDASTDRVGIGTATPLAPLAVSRNANASTQAFITNDDTGNAAVAGLYVGSLAGTGGVQFLAPSATFNATGSNPKEDALYRSRGVVAASTARDGLTLYTVGDDKNIIMAGWATGPAGAREYLRTGSTGVIMNEDGDSTSDLRVEGDTNANLLVVDASADAVGINDSTPDALLDVAGTLRVDGQATFVADPSSTGAANASVYVNPATSASNEMFLACADNGTAVFSVDKEGDVDVRTLANSAAGTCFTGQTGVVCVTDNMAVSPTSGGGVIALRNNSTADVEGFSFYDNSLTNLGGPRYYGSTVADADFTDKMAWVSVGKMISMLRTEAVAAGTVVFEVRDDALGTGVQLFTVDGSGNLFVNAAGTRTKGTITLAAGTGTATVASGSVCVCSDTTAVNAVQCSVTTTTLTANGTGTDVIAYHCL